MPNIVEPDVIILTPNEEINRTKKLIEIAGRVCYKSEDKITDTSSDKFCKMLIERGHESVLEHRSITVKLICDRGVSHELVRHRLSSFSQESTRYCNYSKKDNGQINVINLAGGIQVENKIETNSMKFIQILGTWYSAMEHAEKAYLEMIELGATPQIARSVLPNSLKTEIIITSNIRQWREILRQRTAKAAHPQMRQVMHTLAQIFDIMLPELFYDITAWRQEK